MSAAAADPARADARRVEELLEEIRGMAGPTTWPRVEELVHRLVSLYGAGLERLITAAAPGEAALARACDDELLESLLALHGLHPLPLARRVERALERVRPLLGSHAGGVHLLGLEGDRVRLRLTGTCHGCASSLATLENVLRRAIEAVAPEVGSVDVEGTPAPGGLVELRCPEPG